MSKFTVEENWFTQAGIQAVVIIVGFGTSLVAPHRCGYVLVPSGHPADGMWYDDIEMEVHGGLTFGSSSMKYPIPQEQAGFWIGFDTGHSGDERNPKSLEFCKEQCESMATQLMNQVPKLGN